MRTVGVFVQPKADMGNPDHIRGLVGLVEQQLFTTDPRPYENVAGCDWLDAEDEDWLDPQAPAPDLPHLHSPKDRLILRATVAALMDRRTMLSSITPRNCYGNYIGNNCIGHDYIGHKYVGNNCIGHNYIGHNYVGNNCIGHNYTGHCYVGQYSSGTWAVGLPTMRILADLIFEIVVAHKFCTEESCEKYGLGSLTDTKTMSIEYARTHART
ncbi:MAG: hypothetical protein VX837_04730, partial [Candidatus Thermoplasmatota archaeon]|nr:hypothetical protein [Candidatus Thermoplasmatota archaeon]